MNIFYLHPKAEIAAKMHCDKHCIKMILETAQLLSTAHRELDGNEDADRRGLYRSTHKNHPSSVWARANGENYDWLYDLFKSLLSEYSIRYGKRHASSKLLLPLAVPPSNCPSGDFHAPPQCMPDEYKCSSTTAAYRKYYLGEKMGFAVWKMGAPAWALPPEKSVSAWSAHGAGVVFVNAEAPRFSGNDWAIDERD
jgi:hypothetical protein|tara:strand:+ start:128 stop:715 length:588 start_codon:yes stop_codon:yes gene_type:complete